MDKSSSLKKAPTASRQALSSERSAADVPAGEGPNRVSPKSKKPAGAAAEAAAKGGSSVHEGRADYAGLINEVTMLRSLYSELDGKVSDMLTLMQEARARQEATARAASLQALVDAAPIRGLDEMRARLMQRTVDAVLGGTEWLTAAEVGALADPSAANRHAYASRLIKDGKVFAIERSGVKRYPRYAFDPLGNPLPALREVLRIFAGQSAFRVASWFESTSSTLGGRRPRELLEAEPVAVIFAAQAHTEGPMHG